MGVDPRFEKTSHITISTGTCHAAYTEGSVLALLGMVLV